jgi:hypothetical protein
MAGRGRGCCCLIEDSEVEILAARACPWLRGRSGAGSGVARPDSCLISFTEPFSWRSMAVVLCTDLYELVFPCETGLH